ncbi:hypothetical protein GV67_18340 [Pseudorhizobium pelagicum]|uniref:Uncharacterized protein n=1 Tax=Pseudorhizobium pelagicum TaxID=1509405 RepID=A0A922TC35_9HYPH|nr:hypothetical protein GV67_18340 [Pseudorhizobium pelagicum]KEQ10337.1 hypothetical protein GV68_15610 [Pseudorhizobium pelagicum]
MHSTKTLAAFAAGCLHPLSMRRRFAESAEKSVVEIAVGSLRLRKRRVLLLRLLLRRQKVETDSGGWNQLFDGWIACLCTQSIPVGGKADVFHLILQ